MTDRLNQDETISPPKGDLKIRLRGLIVAVVCWGVIALAAMLTPQQAGYGTHRQMGLTGCDFLARTGYPCPGCGVTTSIAAMAHGRLIQAARAQLFGVMLVLAIAILGLLGLVDVITGKNLLRFVHPRLWWVWVVAAGLLLGWGVKVGLGVLTGEYPLWK